MERIRLDHRHVTVFGIESHFRLNGRPVAGFGVGASGTPQKLANLGPYGGGAYGWKQDQGTEFVLGVDYIPTDAPAGSTITSPQSTTVLTKQTDGSWIGKNPQGVIQGNPWPTGTIEAQQFSATCKSGEKVVTVQATGDMFCVPVDGLKLTDAQGNVTGTLLQNGDTVVSNGNTVHADNTVTLSTTQEIEDAAKAIGTVILHPVAAAKLGAIGMLNPNALDRDKDKKKRGDGIPWWVGPAAGAAGVLLLVVALKK
jgi:hypothetical protein